MLPINKIQWERKDSAADDSITLSAALIHSQSQKIDRYVARMYPQYEEEVKNHLKQKLWRSAYGELIELMPKFLYLVRRSGYGIPGEYMPNTEIEALCARFTELLTMPQ